MLGEDIENMEIRSHRKNMENIENNENMEDKENLENNDIIDEMEYSKHMEHREIMELREKVVRRENMEFMEHKENRIKRDNMELNRNIEIEDRNADVFVNVERDEEPEFWSEQDQTGDKGLENQGKEASGEENTRNISVNTSALISKRSNLVDILIDKLNNIHTKSLNLIKEFGERRNEETPMDAVRQEFIRSLRSLKHEDVLVQTRREILLQVDDNPDSVLAEDLDIQQKKKTLFNLAEIEKGLLLEKINELEEELPELERRILLDKYQEGNRHSTHSVEIDELENMFSQASDKSSSLNRIFESGLLRTLELQKLDEFVSAQYLELRKENLELRSRLANLEEQLQEQSNEGDFVAPKPETLVDDNEEDDSEVSVLLEKLENLDSYYQTILQDANLTLSNLKSLSLDLGSTNDNTELEARTGELMRTRREVAEERIELEDWIAQERVYLLQRRNELSSNISDMNSEIADFRRSIQRD